MRSDLRGTEEHRHPDRIAPAEHRQESREVRRQRRRYPSDLSERQWLQVERLIGQGEICAPHLCAPLRDVADAVNYRWRTGCSWRMLPHDFPPWSTVYTHFRRWRIHGLLSDIRAAVLTNRR
jgi:putative transposase